MLKMNQYESPYFFEWKKLFLVAVSILGIKNQSNLK